MICSKPKANSTVKTAVIREERIVVNWALKPIEQPYDPPAEPSLLSMTVGMVATLDARAPVMFTCDTLLSAHGGIHLNTITFAEEDALFGIIRIIWTFVDNTLPEFLSVITWHAGL